MGTIGVPVELRFWPKVEVSEEGCWPWTGAVNEDGYGLVWDGRAVQAHRVAWRLTFGPIPEGIHVLHHCDNPPCQRPDHLFLGTHKMNMEDRQAKGRQAVGDATAQWGMTNGQVKFTTEQVVEIRRARAFGALLRHISAEYGISMAQASRIGSGKRRARG